MRRVSTIENPNLVWTIVWALLASLAPRGAAACDVCAIYRATELGESREGFRLSVAEQLSQFTTLQRNSEEVPNVAGERLTSSITQVVLGYAVSPRLAFQLNLPIISRTFRRVEDDRLVHGDETGIGDMALVGNVLAFSNVTENSVFSFSLLGGVKFPTGNADPLAEELGEHGRSASAGTPPLESGIHGHDLALGSGSFDGIVGGSLFWSWRRLFATMGGQYAIRSEGDFEYTFANELAWSGGPGVYALLEHTHSLGIQVLLTGETKGNDTQAGQKTNDTAITALYVGPGITFTYGTRLHADVMADLPVVQNNTGLQLVPDFRLRGGITWRF